MSAWKTIFFTDMHTVLMATFYILLVTDFNVHGSLWKILSLIASLGLYVIYMYLVNDFFDMPTDKLSGDHREIHNMPIILVVGLLLSVVALSYYITVIIINESLYSLIYTIAYLLATFYSMPPIRFKCRGLYGLISNILIEGFLPVLLISLFFQHVSLDIMFLLYLVSLRQLELIILHYYADYETDQKAGVKTFVVEVGLEKTENILRYLQPLISLSYIIFSIIITIKAPSFILFFIPLTIGYLLLNNLRQINLYDSEPGKFGPSRFYAEKEKVGEFRRSLSSFFGMSFEGPFSIFAGLILLSKFTPYVVLLLLSIFSQYYFIKGHYLTFLQGIMSLIKSKLSNNVKS